MTGKHDMSTQEKLAEALDFLDRVHRGLISGRISEWPGLREACGVVFQAHAAEAAQAQAQSGEWVMVPKEPTRAMIDAVCKIKIDRLDALRDGHRASPGIVAAVREEWDAMLAAAPQQAAEPVAEMVYFSRTSPLTSSFDKIPVLPGTAHHHVRPELIHHIQPLYPHLQPAQDAKDEARLDWLEAHPRLASIVIDGHATDCYLYGISGAMGLKLREILDAAMAKESER